MSNGSTGRSWVKAYVDRPDDGLDLWLGGGW